MPELPEVEVVRRGLAEHVLGRRIARVDVFHPRSVRRHAAGDADFAARLMGQTVSGARRRGKYLWLELADPVPGSDVLLGHLGMSGQLLVQDEDVPDQPHLRVRLSFADRGPELRFVDQRTFGGLSVDELVGAGPADSPDGADTVPRAVAHIARDPLDPAFDAEVTVAAMRRRRTGLKRALLDQSLVSGIGNIYADEALWRARLHWARPTATLSRPDGRRALAAAEEVMTDALRQGGTSFDTLYVNVNGQSGYFDRSLAVYGQADRPCPRCGTAVRREAFMGRSSYSCPRCQPRPRRPHP